MNEGAVIASLDQNSTLHILESSPLKMLPLKYRMKYLKKGKKQAPSQSLKVTLKNGFQRNAPAVFAKRMRDKWVLYS